MDYSHARFPYPQSHAEAEISSKPPHFFSENNTGVLEPALRDGDIMQHPDSDQLRRRSYVNNPAVMSPGDAHPWSTPYPTGVPMDHSNVVQSPHHEHRHGFGRDSGYPLPAIGHDSQPQGWQYEHASGHCTPSNRMDFEQPPTVTPFDAPHYISHRSDSARGSFSHPPRRHTFNGPEEGFIPAPQVQTPMSPHSHQDWMTMAAQEVECRPQSRRMGGGAPAQTTVDFQRGDGIRKKNARIEIPQERSIENIEHMLETVTDEDVLKELKQQKRLLRNREAALASRQRKKKNTEDLEMREKEGNKLLEDLHAQIITLSNERARHEQNCQILSHQLQASQRNVEAMQEEKRDMMLKHTEETASLRKRIRVLTDQFEHDLTAPAMSTVPSSTGFGEFNDDMAALNMGPHEWDSFMFANDLHTDPFEDINLDVKPEPGIQPTQLDRSEPPPAATVSTASKLGSDSTSDQTVTQGMLFFLLLCGAFVASRPSLRPSDLPQVPADVRAAAPKVLNNLLYESQGSSAPNTRTSHLEASEPTPSGLSAPHLRSQSRLDRLHHRVTAPTRQQEIDSAFSLTTAEYASITNLDLTGDEERTPRDDVPPRARRNLAETLASMQDENSRSSRAEVYTRSLLWDQIPVDVVKQFQELVRDHNEIEIRQQQLQDQQQQQQRQNDEMNDFKVDL